MADEVLSFPTLLDRVAERSFERPPALVSNAHVTGLGVARALAAHDVPVIALDRTLDGVAPSSTAVTLAGRVAYPLDDRARYREQLEALAAAMGPKPVAFGCMDEWVHALAATRPEGVRLSFSADAIDGLLDKTALYARCSELGVPHPETYRLAETDPTGAGPPIRTAAEAAERLGFPLAVKPARKRRFEEAVGTNVLLVETNETYREAVRTAADAGVRVMAQRAVDVAPGEDRSLAVYRSETDGETTGIVGNARVRYPTYGTSCVVDRVTDPQLRERGESVLADAEYTGIAEAEFVYDREREEFLLLDVNTRPWKWISLPVAAGANLPMAAYAAVTDAEYESTGTEPARWVYLRDYLSLLADGALADRLENADWRRLASGAFEAGGGGAGRRLTTGAYRPSDPAPTAKLLETEFVDREYYCSC